MKKIKLFLILFILIIAILILVYIILPKYIYSLDKVSRMLNSAQFSDNIHIKNFYEDDYTTTYMNTYIKDNIEYIYQKTTSTYPNIYDFNADGLTIIYENSKTITISHIDKTIWVNNNQNTSSISKHPYNGNFFIEVEQHGLYEHLGIYKYCGKETVNEKKCIKVSMTDNYENNINVTYYYIDLETNLIQKIERYSGDTINELKLNSTDIYEYYFNSVTDKDIPEFNINDYPDYEYLEW